MIELIPLVLWGITALLIGKVIQDTFRQLSYSRIEETPPKIVYTVGDIGAPIYNGVGCHLWNYIDYEGFEPY